MQIPEVSVKGENRGKYKVLHQHNIFAVSRRQIKYFVVNLPPAWVQFSLTLNLSKRPIEIDKYITNPVFLPSVIYYSANIRQISYSKNKKLWYSLFKLIKSRGISFLYSFVSTETNRMLVQKYMYLIIILHFLDTQVREILSQQSIRK